MFVGDCSNTDRAGPHHDLVLTSPASSAMVDVYLLVGVVPTGPDIAGSVDRTTDRGSGHGSCWLVPAALRLSN
jgi:hypothetical protein